MADSPKGVASNELSLRLVGVYTVYTVRRRGSHLDERVAAGHAPGCGQNGTAAATAQVFGAEPWVAAATQSGAVKLYRARK